MKNHTKESKNKTITYKEYTKYLKFAENEIKEYQKFIKDLKSAYRNQRLIKNVLK